MRKRKDLAWSEGSTTVFVKKYRKPLYEAIDALTDAQFKALLDLLRSRGFPTG